MTESSRQSLGDALTQYLVQLKEAERHEAQQELVKFAQWCGWEKDTWLLTPPEIEGYALANGNPTAEGIRRLTRVKAFLSHLDKQKLTNGNLAPHLKLPKARKLTRAQAAKPAPEQAHFTVEGMQDLQQKLEQLKQERVKVVADIERAMADKDFRENAPLDAAKERQGQIESEIRGIEHTLTRAVVSDGKAGRVVDEARQVRPGRRVTLRDLRNDKTNTYVLVDAREADPVAGKLSLVSPVGKALLGRGVGDEVRVTTPSGTLRFRIENVES